MKTIKPYIDAILRIWQENSPAARIGILLLAAIFVVAIAGVGYWSIQPSFVVLDTTGSDGDKIDKVIDALDKAGIEYQLSGAGGNLMVDQRDFPRARQLAKNSGVDVGGGFGGGSNSPFDTPADRRNLARIQKQQSLATSIKKMNVIDHADVHLSVPDRGPFDRKKSAPTASVLLTLRPGERLEEHQAYSIASFVANAVEDLDPEAVQITDKEGRNYTIPDASVSQISSQVEYTEEQERKFARKAQDQLTRFLGLENANVEVTLDFTFANGTREKTTYDPDGKVASNENLDSSTTTGLKPVPAGVTGTQGNPSPENSKSLTEVVTKSEIINSDYLVPTTIESETNTTPIRNFMTVSVVVNSESAVAKQEDGTLTPGLSEKVEALVKNAVGFQADTDQITVEFLPFSNIGLEAEPVVVPFDWTRVMSIIENASLAIAAGLAFLLGFMMLRRIRPAPDQDDSTAAGQIDRDRLENVNQLSDLIKNHPDVFTQIVRAWSGADLQEKELPAEQKAA